MPPPAYNPIEHLPPPVNLLPTLRVNARGTAYLHASLWRKLGIKPHQAIDLIPPSNGSQYWHLDLRPQAPKKVDWYDETRPRIRGVRLPAHLVVPGHPLTLRLLPGEPAFPGFYPLLPDAEPTQTR